MLVIGAGALLFFLPFVWPVHRPPQPIFDSEWLAAVILSVVAVLFATLPVVKVSLRWPLLGWLLAFVAIALAQNHLGQLHYSQQAYFAFLYAAAIGGAYWVGRALVAANLTRAALETIASAMVVGAVLSVAIQSLQLIGVRGLPWWLYFEFASTASEIRPSGNVGQPNILAAYLSWSILGVLLLNRCRLHSAYAAILVAIMAIGIGLTSSRIGMIFAVLVAMGCWAPWGLRPTDLRARLALSSSIMVGLVVGSLSIHAFGDTDPSVMRMVGGSYGLRTIMWRDALVVASSSPWFGVGFGDYGSAQYWAAQSHPSLLPTAYVHNIVLQVAAELGWPMALLLTALGVWWGTFQLRERLADPGASFGWALVLLIGIYSMLEWPLWSLVFAVPTALLFGIAEPEAPGPEFSASSKLLLAAGLGGVVLSGLAFLDFDEMSRTWIKIDFDQSAGKQVDDATLVNLLGLAHASSARPFAERLYSYIRAPHAIQPTPEELELHNRLLWQGGEPRTITRLIILNAKAGRVDESVRHLERFNVFYPDQLRRQSGYILQSLKEQGANADPLRSRLEAIAASTSELRSAPTP